VAEVVRTAGRRAAGAAPAVRVRLAADLPDITAAPADLQQLIGNLVNNAVDAVEGRDGAAVEVATAREDDGLVLTVKDNGHGIPPEILERIFDPFFTTKPVGKGTGLGLSICYGIVSKMGGEISVDSAVGEGTTFQVTLPLAPPGAAAQAPAPDGAEGAVEGELEAVPHGPTHVLLVDDELELVDALSRRLVRRGVTVYAATDPGAALAILDAHPIDVAILDVRLRGASGLDLLREIKRRQPEVEAILLSGNQTIATAIEGIKLGASDYLLKPCDIPDLLGRIGRAKARKAAREQQSIEARVRDIAMRRE
jgi:ActR/RegA family two-component response regulator/anti-sigma regulatory factor (Ser/Thr protein kinase)